LAIPLLQKIAERAFWRILGVHISGFATIGSWGPLPVVIK
jgi:hypothetical protein